MATKNKKTWRWEIVSGNTAVGISEYLNKLDAEGVKPKEIKITERSLGGFYIHYYADHNIVPDEK